jgi:iron complex outermembrane recepter protein
MKLRRFALLPFLLMSQAALAQDVLPVPEAENDDLPGAQRGEILVVGTHFLGEVEAAQPPIATLSEADIAAYGTSSLAELLGAVSPQTGTGRGRGGGMPVILMNGQRIANFREMANFPPEAIRRMEVLPEEVALRYGFSANQRVINFILKDNFASKMLRGEFNASTHGGLSESELQATLQRISGARRLNINLYLEDTGFLTEAERGVIQSAPVAPGSPDPAQYRTLLPDTRDMGLSGTWSKGFGPRGMDGSLSVNGSISRNDSRTLSGLDTFLLTSTAGTLRPLARINRTEMIEGGGSFNRKLGDWNFTATIDAGHGVTNSRIDRASNASAQNVLDRARIVNDRASLLTTFNGSLARLPAGPIGATLKAGFAHTGIISSDTRRTTGETRLKRGDASAGINLSLPITSRRDNVLRALGDVTLNFSAGLNHLSDFGDLKDWSAGLTWGLTEKLSLGASYIVNQAAPSLNDLGGPQIVTLNVPTYDFATGQSVLVAISSGGNRALKREAQRDIKLSVNWKLPFISDASFDGSYFRNRSSDFTAPFPLLTPAIEAAFPGRAVRDAAGRLVAIDRRPVTFSSSQGSRIRYGFNLSGFLRKAPPGGAGGFGMMMGGMGRPGAGGGGPMGGFGRPGGGPPGNPMNRGRWNLSIYHAVELDSSVRVAPGGPVLDLLGGDALSGGGLTRHSVEFEGGGFYRGFGLRMNGNWAAPTRLRASGAPGTSDLRFGSTFKFNLRMFAELGQQQRLVKASPFFKGLRINLRVDNLFDSRQKVTDANGLVPLTYQADYLDPKGRMVGIDIRKTF